MKVCKLCGSTYGDKVAFCFRDGQPLTLAEEAPEPPRAAAPAPLGLDAMLDLPEPTALRGAADGTDLPEPAGLQPPLDDPFDLPLPGRLAGPAAGPAAPAAEPPAPALTTLSALVGEAEPPAQPGPAPAPMATEAVLPGPSAPIDEELPPPAPIAAPAEVDPEALADITRHLRSDTLVPSGREEEPDALPPPRSTEAPLDAQVAAEQDFFSGQLSELATEAPATRTEQVIGLEGTYEDEVDRAPEAAPRSKAPLFIGIGVGVAVVLGLAVVVLGSGDKDPGPMAAKPEERAAPVVQAPAPPAPPAPEPVAEVEPPPPAEPPAAPAAVEPASPPAVASTPPAAPVAPATPPSDNARTTASTTAPSSSSTAGSPAGSASANPNAASSPATPSNLTERGTAATARTGSGSAESDPWSTEAARSGRLTITSIPTGATVFLGGKQIGRTPVSTEVTYGTHAVRIELGGYASEQRSLNLSSPELAASFELKPLVVSGTVNIFGPTGATVLVDGAQVGKIPTSVKLTEGAHSFEVRTADGTTYSSSRDIRFNGGSTVTVTLSP